MILRVPLCTLPVGIYCYIYIPTPITHPTYFRKLRIISGTAKGHKLCTPPQQDSSIRPTADRARESLFSILGERVKDSQVLDLFAGTGALGLEAISRGAQQLALIDKGHHSLDILKKNASIFPLEYLKNKKIVIIKDDLKRPSFIKKLPVSFTPQFDIIFADPPYDQDLSLPVLEYINAKQLLTDDGIFVIEERHNIILPEKLTHLECIDRRKYGQTRFTFYHSIKVITQNGIHDTTF